MKILIPIFLISCGVSSSIASGRVDYFGPFVLCFVSDGEPVKNLKFIIDESVYQTSKKEFTEVELANLTTNRTDEFGNSIIYLSLHGLANTNTGEVHVSVSGLLKLDFKGKQLEIDMAKYFKSKKILLSPNQLERLTIDLTKIQPMDVIDQPSVVDDSDPWEER